METGKLNHRFFTLTLEIFRQGDQTTTVLGNFGCAHLLLDVKIPGSYCPPN
jgi:hypothetical protein